MSKPIKPKPSLGVTRVNILGVLSRAGLMHAAILLAAALFPSLPISMAAFLHLIQTAAAAQAASKTRAKGLAALRDTKVDALWTAMLALRTYVGGLASELDATSASSLIQSAGLVVAQAATHTKLLLSATYVPATGVVHVSGEPRNRGTVGPATDTTHGPEQSGQWPCPWPSCPCPASGSGKMHVPGGVRGPLKKNGESYV